MLQYLASRFVAPGNLAMFQAWAKEHCDRLGEALGLHILEKAGSIEAEIDAINGALKEPTASTDDIPEVAEGTAQASNETEEEELTLEMLEALREADVDRFRELREAAAESKAAKSAEEKAQGEAEQQNAVLRVMPISHGRSDIWTPELLWGFGLLWPRANPMTRLYSTNRDGRSIHMVAKAIEGYRGPSVLLVEDRRGRVFGGMAAIEWRDSSSLLGKPAPPTHS